MAGMWVLARWKGSWCSLLCRQPRYSHSLAPVCRGSSRSCGPAHVPGSQRHQGGCLNGPQSKHKSTMYSSPLLGLFPSPCPPLSPTIDRIQSPIRNKYRAPLFGSNVNKRCDLFYETSSGCLLQRSAFIMNTRRTPYVFPWNAQGNHLHSFLQLLIKHLSWGAWVGQKKYHFILDGDGADENLGGGSVLCEILNKTWPGPTEHAPPVYLVEKDTWKIHNNLPKKLATLSNLFEDSVN